VRQEGLARRVEKNETGFDTKKETLIQGQDKVPALLFRHAASEGKIPSP
jgi:hypothetical protein